MAATGGVLAWSGVRALTGGLSDATAALPGIDRVGGRVTVDLTAVWPLLAVLAGLLGIGAGVLAVVRGRTWPAMGRRYERAGAPAAAPAASRRPETDEDRAQAAWKALDRGDDPTQDSTGPASP
jgi:uncharacterized membrane protein (TIGR02234 family)